MFRDYLCYFNYTNGWCISVNNIGTEYSKCTYFITLWIIMYFCWVQLAPNRVGFLFRPFVLWLGPKTHGKTKGAAIKAGLSHKCLPQSAPHPAIPLLPSHSWQALQQPQRLQLASSSFRIFQYFSPAFLCVIFFCFFFFLVALHSELAQFLAFFLYCFDSRLIHTLSIFFPSWMRTSVGAKNRTPGRCRRWYVWKRCVCKVPAALPIWAPYKLMRFEANWQTITQLALCLGQLPAAPHHPSTHSVPAFSWLRAPNPFC